MHRTGSPSSAPRPKSLVFGDPVVIVISLKSSKVPYIGRDGSSAEKCSWVGYLLGEEEWDRVRVSVRAGLSHWMARGLWCPESLPSFRGVEPPQDPLS